MRLYPCVAAALLILICRVAAADEPASPSLIERQGDLAALANALDDLRSVRAELDAIEKRASCSVKEHKSRRLMPLSKALGQLELLKKGLPEREHGELRRIELSILRERDWLHTAAPEELRRDQLAVAAAERDALKPRETEARRRYEEACRRLGLTAK